MTEYMTAEEFVEASKGTTFETFWNVFIESQKRFDKKAEEYERQREESQKRFDRGMEESRKEFDRKMADLAENLGGIGNSLGEMTEAVFAVRLWEKFNEFGYPFTKQGPRLKFIKDGKVLTEVDFFLENGDYAMPVEVKTDLKKADIDKHIERIEKIRGYMDVRGDKRKLVGAVAGGVIRDDVLRYAQENGFYVVQQSGDAVAIVTVPEGFMPREW